ncbi:MAG: DUF1874 domain-containing protein [Clostridia bacterium]|nr:DUF1874 domain-containing protein [Clostridia bacterium]
MSKVLLLNAFSLQMLSRPDMELYIQEVTPEWVAEQICSYGVDSAVGHADTARVLSGILNAEIAFDRKNVVLEPGACAVVAQVTGGRLPEGCTALPEGTSIKFLHVYVQEYDYSR